MKKSVKALAVVAAIATSLTVVAAAPSFAAKNKTACVILPDTNAGSRWEPGDHPALKQLLTKAGFKTNFNNAHNDVAQYATIADQMLATGCGVMILVDLNGAGVTVTQKAHKQGIPVIAYDRPIAGADYYISFDNTKVGALQGQIIVNGLKAEGKDPATASIVYGSGDPTDGNAAMFLNGALGVLNAAGAKAAFTMKGTWDAPTEGTEFEQAYTALGGKVDAVLAPNDANANAIITILDKNNQTAVISGQDAGVVGLSNVLLGKQTATVYKPFHLEANLAAATAVALLQGKKPAYTKKNNGVPFIFAQPILINASGVEQVVKNGDITVAALCTGDVAAACTKYGVQ
jgi:D-xylose transport system substrate-binding protein